MWSTELFAVHRTCLISMCPVWALIACSGSSINDANGGSTTRTAPASGGNSALSSATFQGGAIGTGGSDWVGSTMGGTLSLGGTQSTGGDVATGGTKNLGGTTGIKSTGGSAATGGTTGIKSAGGSAVTGGTRSVGVGGTTASGTTATGGTRPTGGNSAMGGTGTHCDQVAVYDQLILCEHPVGYWAMNKASGTEPDLTTQGHDGTHRGAAVPLVELPNADQASDFNGSSQYVTIPSSTAFSIPTTGSLTWEAWIRPDVLQFPNDSGGYVDWMGKCEDYAPTCEWEARMYNLTNDENRPNRLSAYVFNPSAGLGSGADWQQSTGQIRAGQWYHVVGEYTTLSTPADCSNASKYPGSINIWVNGVPWNHASHGQTGCMSQYDVVPVANDSAVNVGTMASDAWFQGAIGKLAIYDYLLTQSQITAHYVLMTGKQPTGGCASTCSF